MNHPLALAVAMALAATAPAQAATSRNGVSRPQQAGLAVITVFNSMAGSSRGVAGRVPQGRFRRRESRRALPPCLPSWTPSGDIG
jgi:hypothetical protein